MTNGFTYDEINCIVQFIESCEQLGLIDTKKLE